MEQHQHNVDLLPRRQQRNPELVATAPLHPTANRTTRQPAASQQHDIPIPSTASTMKHSYPPSAISQYKAFRISPTSYPSVDRIRFVKLDDGLLPPSLRSTTTNSVGSDALIYHPALLYSIPELVRDAHLESSQKHRLIMEWRKEKRMVGRLLGWRDDGSNYNADNGSGVYFPDASVDLIRLHQDDSLEFYDYLAILEENCARLESAVNDSNSTYSRQERMEIKQHCHRWKRGVHFALNVLGMDLGEEIVPFTTGPTTTSVEEDDQAPSLVNKSSDDTAVTKKRKALANLSNNGNTLNAATEIEKLNNKKQTNNTTTVSSSQNIKSIQSEIDPHTPWPTVWKILKSQGWKWKGPSGLMTDYYYIKPGKKIKDGIVNVDYFCKVEDVMDFCRTEFGWLGDDVANKTAVDTTTRDDVNADPDSIISDSTIKQDENAPPLLSPIDPHTSWRCAWDTLLSSGWTWKTGSGLMTDYYYIKPGKKIKGGIVNVDYFVRRQDIEEYMKVNYGWLGETESMDDCQKPKKKKGKKEKESMKEDEEYTKKPKAKVKRESMEFEEDKVQIMKKPKVAKIMVETISSKTTVKHVELKEEEEEVIPFATTWKTLWKQLKSEGWEVVNASKYNKLHDWYYVRPWVDLDSEDTKKGVDYFLCPEDVVNFVNRADDVVTEDAKSVEGGLSEDDEEEEEPVKEVIDWKSLWSELKKEGWQVKRAGKVNPLHDWYYIRPGVVIPGDADAKLGEDYFLGPGEVMDFVERTGWKSEAHGKNGETAALFETAKSPAAVNSPDSKKGSTPKHHAAVGSSFNNNGNDPQTPLDCQTKPQDPAIPLPPSPESSPCSTDSNDPYAWHNLWDKLKLAGWRQVKAGKINKLHDYYYVRPGRDPSDEDCILGRHYFQSREDVIQYEKACEENEAKKSVRESMDVMQATFEKEAELDQS